MGSAAAERKRRRATVATRPLALGSKLPWAREATEADPSKVYTLTDFEDVEAFWSEHSNANIGLCLKGIGCSRIVVVDIDTKRLDRQAIKGLFDVLRPLGIERSAGCWIQTTASGGYHFIFDGGTQEIPGV